MYTALLQNIENHLSQNHGVDQCLQWVCTAIKQTLPNYDWVGFYFHHPSKKELHLKAYAGNPTEHTIIPFGKGICGQVAVSDKNFVVDDVRQQDNYIACSIDVKSEIVVPIFIKNKNVGQIDIDSNKTSAFSKKDEEFLVAVNMLIATFLLRSGASF
jgi:GAF domain-containing protein